MNKNFTQTSLFFPVVTPKKEGPAKATLAKIRQFARAYSFAPVSNPALGDIVAN